MTTKMINLQEKQATITHTQSTAGCKAVRTSRLIKTLSSCPGMKRHISLLSGGRDSPPSVYLSRRPRRPTCCRWIRRRRRSPFIRLETFGSIQPSVKACLHAAGCFLQELIPTAAGPTSHHTHVVCRDKHLTLTTGTESVRDRKQSVMFQLLSQVQILSHLGSGLMKFSRCSSLCCVGSALAF